MNQKELVQSAIDARKLYLARAEYTDKETGQTYVCVGVSRCLPVWAYASATTGGNFIGWSKEK